MTITARALHYVFKIGDRAKNAAFFRNILGMKVLRHEEFAEGCEAQCNGAYDGRWSKTMFGYGPEATHFAVELTYNYSVSEYLLGNEFGGITIKSKEVLERAKTNNYPVTVHNDVHVIKSPDGYTFFILNEPQPTDEDPVQKVTLHSSDIERTLKYYHETLLMNVESHDENLIVLQYAGKQVALQFNEIWVPLNRAEAYGRIAFSVPAVELGPIQSKIKETGNTVLTPLIKLDTPGKATVEVVILADPDGLEICFVNKEGFDELSAVDPKADELLDKYIRKDPRQKETSKP